MGLYFYFLLTLIIELPFVTLYFRSQWKQALLIGFLLNLFTWPLLHVFLFETTINITVLEIVITITEGLGYYLFMNCKW